MRKMTGKEFSEQVEFFDTVAQTNWLSGLHQALKDKSGTWEKKDVLDVGCGTGRLLLKGAKEAASLTGIDLSEGMIKKARKLEALQPGKASTTFIVGDAYALPFVDRTFDISISTLVMFLLPEPEKGIKEMARVTKSNGISILLNPTPKMDPVAAEEYANAQALEGFEKESFLKWSNVSPRRHRFESGQLSELLYEHGASYIHQEKALGDLALLTKIVWN
ncbi:class I SAM-dependent methyltransferase [Alteribacillus sp. JSM 102045]|uniref:class I SAM-dependent methyltransferase n=1 Tax=Alteribacillus sp. JSM 102045 TaxID=1562101 RepID=UPI0035C089DC